MEKVTPTHNNSNGELALVFSNFLLQTQGIIGFRKDALFLVENGKQQLTSRAYEQIQQFIKTTESEKPNPSEKTLSDILSATLLMSSPDAVIRQSKRRIDAASIVFVHSLLDATLYSLCCVSYDSDPNAWLNFVKDRQLKIGDVLAKGQDAATKVISRDYVASLERESLIKKSDKLHAICQPPANANYASNYKFSRDTLERFDKLRHDIVHKLQFSTEIPGADGMLDFGIKTGVYFSLMVGEEYDLKTDVTKEQKQQLLSDNLPNESHL
jgi:hypothetical protein